MEKNEKKGRKEEENPPRPPVCLQEVVAVDSVENKSLLTLMSL